MWREEGRAVCMTMCVLGALFSCPWATASAGPGLQGPSNFSGPQSCAALQAPRVQRSALCKHLDKVFTGGDKTGIIFYGERITYGTVTKLDKAVACGEGSS